MKPEIQSIGFDQACMRVSVKVNDTLNINVTLPIPPIQYENMTVAQVRDAAIQHAKNQHRD
ncbi:hypothetical protein HB13667_29240 [Pseudomonas putida]|jgi:hypothetical protein|uniref:Uncharacterized protein n=3 Tax=Pseudomonas TaxID=286 RepID=V9V9M4_9PSED|nr:MULTISPECIES: hypothetical protein [Pseudomonas]PPB17414.1 hypothetical protein HV87_23510 [Pseudomonas aeruginosa]AHC85728.1 hypothetical protein X969_11320 [Pseudomonas monteilii SB3078]AHC91088.1 hypothetical protein X970_10975 [Pseudomonas monteilii SB3101]EKT4454424.1 hypothetical protein [Pseudomonas putida]EKT4511239.1 hypothetical protein [Pseudomonas putida]